MSLPLPVQRRDVSLGSDSKQLAVFTAELRRTFIADHEGRAGYILMLAIDRRDLSQPGRLIIFQETVVNFTMDQSR